MSNQIDDGVFRRKSNFTQVQNSVAQNMEMSLRARGLYLLIQSYITLPDGTFTKDFFMKKAKSEGKKAFDSAWKELKQKGFLVMHRYRMKKGFRNEYELLEEAHAGAHTIFYDIEGNITKKLYSDVDDSEMVCDTPLCDNPKGEVTNGNVTKVDDNNNTNITNTLNNNTKNNNTSNFELLDKIGCPEQIKGLLEKWVRYKNDSNEMLTESSMVALIELIKKAVGQNGYNYVSDVIDHAIASNYKGIPLSNLNKSGISKPKTSFHQFDMKHDYNYAEMEEELLKH